MSWKETDKPAAVTALQHAADAAFAFAARAFNSISNADFSRP
jgi:hypothetical protein